MERKKSVSKDRKRVASKEPYEVAPIAKKFGTSQKKVREILENMKAEGRHPQSRNDVEAYMMEKAGFSKDEIAASQNPILPGDSETVAPDLTNSTHVNG